MNTPYHLKNVLDFFGLTCEEIETFQSFIDDVFIMDISGEHLEVKDILKIYRSWGRFNPWFIRDKQKVVKLIHFKDLQHKFVNCEWRAELNNK